MAAAVPYFPTDFKHQLVHTVSSYEIPGHHDGRTGTIINDKSAGKEASVPQLHQRQGQVHFCFVGRRIMRKM
jgi:hypothetical protein